MFRSVKWNGDLISDDGCSGLSCLMAVKWGGGLISDDGRSGL